MKSIEDYAKHFRQVGFLGRAFAKLQRERSYFVRGPFRNATRRPGVARVGVLVDVTVVVLAVVLA